MADVFQTDEPIITAKFEDLVGEGKKYRDPDAAAHAIVEKDTFIERLKQENADMRTSLSKRETEEQFLDRLKQLSQQQPPKVENQPPQDGAPAVTPEDVEKIVERREAQKRSSDNLATSIAKLQETFGDDYKRHVAKQAQTLGMTTAELTELASRNPSAFFRLIGVEGTQQQRQTDAFAPPRSAVTTSVSTGTTVKDYAYYSKIRAEKGEAAYFNPAVQNEMWASLAQLGEAEFYKRR